jgi:hypothetical protein
MLGVVSPATHPFTRDRVREGRRLQKASRRLAARLGEMLTIDVLKGAMDALDLDEDDILDDAAAVVLADLCVHEWRDEGRTLLQRFAESEATRRLKGDERILLDRWQQSRLSLLRVDEVWPGVGMRLYDALAERDLDVFDPALSRELPVGFWLIARPFACGSYWMTTAAVTLLGPLDDAFGTLRADLMAMEESTIPLVLARIAFLVYSTLEREEGPGEEGPFDGGWVRDGIEPLRFAGDEEPRLPRPGRNEPCPCGSGKKYKKCCGLEAAGLKRADDGQALELEVVLEGTEPPVWRRILVSPSTSLADLHDIVQMAMGWTDSHLHHFMYGGKVYGPDSVERALPERDVLVGNLLRKKGDTLGYEYDFGDSWVHTIRLVAVRPPAEGDRLPDCLDGERACPPEDCGGVFGYEELLRILADPEDEEHEERLEWVGDDFAPEAFDPKAVSRRLRRLFGR